MRSDPKAREPLVAIGGGCCMAGAILLLAGSQTAHAWMMTAGQILVASGTILAIFRAYRQWRA